MFREADIDLNRSESFLKHIVFFSAVTVYATASYFHDNNHKLDALFSYNRAMLNKPAESYFTRKFSNYFVVMDIGLWHIRSSFCLVKHFKSSFGLLSFSFWPSGNYRLMHLYHWWWTNYIGHNHIFCPLALNREGYLDTFCNFWFFAASNNGNITDSL